ncbi:CIC11C00000000289 [Sungouiella intermedia]|uniref:Mevalonate kinase n=1 Tax=Sungouiella intermedia TaxID=45354 RepID=A0A1L0BHP8_9ASCO|nr:CIC11C00000000289 [[Candida] intermedia]
MSFYVSAPGKVILFGEHSAVYGKPAIAAALSLRAYLLVVPSEKSDEIVLEFPDIQLKHKWNLSDIPWELINEHLTKKDGKPDVTEELVPEILDQLADLLADTENNLHYIACRCFLYLYVNLCGPETPGCHFCIRLTLPIGAGLGSSASTAVCLSTALAKLGGHLTSPELKLNDKHLRKDTPDANFIDSWSLMGEKCFHGNPSGIDNAVATHGGAVLYQRMKGPGNPSVRTSVRNFSALKLLLTNTKVPRSTAELVGGVAQINTLFPKISESILDAMEHVSNDAYQLMVQPFFDKSELSALVNINHGLLVALGVSHPSLEKIKIIADLHKIGATKLTGAGGGGCAITLLNENVGEDELAAVEKEFEQNGFETFTTMLGGKGVGLLEGEGDMFSTEKLAGFQDRDEIEAAVGASTLDGWRFW